MSTRFTKASLLTGTFMAGALIASPALAQDAAAPETNEAEEAEGAPIIVTGSRIQRRNVDTAAPVAVVSDEEFSLSGTVNVENVINTLPQVIPGTTSFSNNPGNGTATLNLRGLGTARTLVLVNGRRWMSFDTAQIVDLNTIPNFLIDSVDVVTGGASATYGSDALAGVVNFRLRQVDGVEVGGQYALTERGDGETYQLHGAIGTSFDDGRGSATVFAEYFNRADVFQGDRAFSNFALGGESFGADLLQFGSSTLPNGVLRYTGGANGDAVLPAGTEFGNAGEAGFGNGVVFDDVPGDFRFRAGDTYNYAPVNYLQLPQERYLVGGMADYDIGGGHTFYTEVAYVNNRVAQELAATPVTGFFDIDLATAEQFLIPGDFAQLQAIDAAETATNLASGATDDPGVINFFVQRRTIEASRRNSLDERNAFRVLGGIKGPINDFISYDAHYFYTRTRNANVQAGNISRAAFAAGLDGTGDVALNIYGLGTLTDDMFNSIAIQAQNGDISTLEVANASINGTLGDFAIGDSAPVGFAFGVEYRGVGSEFIPDTALSSGDVIGFNAGTATVGSYNVKEVFGELNVPIEFGSARLELDGKARYSDYSLDAVGGVFTYAGGVTLSPIPDVILRAQYQRAVRAPNVGELFGGQSIGFPGANDPCADPANAADATVIALCTATGVPAANVGDPNIQLNAQIPALFGGNPDLEEETSDSFTAGIILQPSFLPGLTVTADYFDIKIESAISVLGGSLQGLLDLCYLQLQDLSSPACQAFVGSRNSAGAIVTENPPLVGNANIAEISTSGVDLEFNYQTTIPFSLFSDTGEQSLNLNFLGTWTESSASVPVVGQPTTIECSGRFAGQCGEPTPEFKWTSRASFTDGPVTTSLRWRHLGAVDSEDSIVVDPVNGIDYAAFNGINTIDSYDLVDLSFAFAVNENVTINLGVTNLFDTLPGAPEFDDGGTVTNRPNSLLLGDNQEQANTYPSTYDVLGRRYFLSGSFKF
jgi:outer membrane receptor protein involved in Fe transport